MDKATIDLRRDGEENNISTTNPDIGEKRQRRSEKRWTERSMRPSQRHVATGSKMQVSESSSALRKRLWLMEERLRRSQQRKFRGVFDVVTFTGQQVGEIARWSRPDGKSNIAKSEDPAAW